MEFTPKAIFFCAADSALNERLSQEVGTFLSEQPISQYVLSFSSLQELASFAECDLGVQVSKLQGQGDIQLSAKIPGRALRLVNIVVALGYGKEESTFAGQFERILSLTQTPTGRPNFNVLIVDSPISQLRSRALQIVFDRVWEQGSMMKEDAYVAACTRLVSTLALMPTDGDLNRLVFRTASRIVSAYAQVFRIPNTGNRNTINTLFRRLLAGKIENEDQHFTIWDMIAASLATDTAQLVTPFGKANDGREDRQASIPHVRIKLFASGAARGRYLRSRLDAYNARKSEYLAQLLAEAGTQLEKIWRRPVAQEAGARVHACLENAVRGYRLGALGRELEGIERKLADTIKEPSAWQFIRDLQPLTCTAFPFTRFWAAGFVVILASTVFSVFSLGSPAFQIATWVSAVGYWPLLLLLGYLRLRQTSLEIESAMHRNMGAVPTFVDQNCKNFEMSRMNFLRRMLLRLVRHYSGKVGVLRQRISQREFQDEQNFQQELARMKVTLGDDAFNELESYVRTGADSALINGLDRTDPRFIIEPESSELVFQEAFRTFVGSVNYRRIARLFLEHQSDILLRPLTSRQQLPIGFSNRVESDPKLRQIFILSPVPSGEVSAILKQGGSEIEGRVLTIPAPDCWIVVHVAPIAE